MRRNNQELSNHHELRTQPSYSHSPREKSLFVRNYHYLVVYTSKRKSGFCLKKHDFRIFKDTLFLGEKGNLFIYFACLFVYLFEPKFCVGTHMAKKCGKKNIIKSANFLMILFYIVQREDAYR